MNRVYVVTAVDHGESCDGKAETIGVIPDGPDAQEKAKNLVTSEIQAYCDKLAGMPIVADFEKMEVCHLDSDELFCAWNIELKELS